jgi:hypothetical protein
MSTLQARNRFTRAKADLLAFAKQTQTGIVF